MMSWIITGAGAVILSLVVIEKTGMTALMAQIAIYVEIIVNAHRDGPVEVHIADGTTRYVLSGRIGGRLPSSSAAIQSRIPVLTTHGIVQSEIKDYKSLWACLASFLMQDR